MACQKFWNFTWPDTEPSFLMVQDIFLPIVIPITVILGIAV
jgi:hypothetical protein